MASVDHAMKPILFYVESISLCHLARMITIAEILRPLGHAIVFACGENHRKLVEEKGFSAHTVPLTPPELVYGRLQQFQPMYQLGDLETYFQHDLKLISTLKPSLVLFDMRLTIPLVCRKLGLPAVSVVNGIWTPYFLEPKSTPFYIRNACHLPQHALDYVYNSRIGKAFEPLLARRFASALDPLYEHHGEAALHDFRNYTSAGNRCLVADIPELVPLSKHLPTTIHIGPALWDPPASLRGQSVSIPKDRPAIYMSLGTSLFPDSLVGPSVQALLVAGYRVVLQTGGRAFPNLPSNPRLHVYNFVANSEVLRQVALLISHGGVTTSYEALVAGVPIVGIPSFSDQQWNMDRVVISGAGKMLNPSQVTPKLLVKTTDALLSDERYRTQAGVLGSKITAFPTKEIVTQALRPLLKAANPY